MKKTISVTCGIILLFLGACQIKEWTMPNWDVTVRIPLINERYFIFDLADGENLIIDENNVLVMQGAGSMTTPNFGAVPYNADINTDPIPLTAGIQINLTLPIHDPVNQYELVYGVMESGVIETLFSDIAPSVQSIRIVFHGINQPDAAPLEISYENQGVWTQTDLSGCWIGSPFSSQVINEMMVSINALAAVPDGTIIGNVQIRNQGGFSFGEFKGILHNYRLDMPESGSTIDISYPLGIDQSVTLVEARLEIELENWVGFDCTFYGEFFAENTSTGETCVLPILDENNQPYTANAANGGIPTITNIVMENNVSGLLQIMPDKVEIRNAYFIISSSASTPIGSVRMTDHIRGDYTVSSPFRFILTDNPVEIHEPIKVEITEQNQNLIRKNGRSASFDLEITNRLPVGAQATLYVGVTPEIDVNDPATYQLRKVATIQSANANPYQQSIEITLNNEELLVFANPQIYLKWVFRFESTAGMPVTIYASTNDYIHLRSMLIADIFVGEDK